MQAIEIEARALGRTLLVLDTASEEAERLYERHGWVRLGSIPDYALWPQGGWCPATIYYRHLVPLLRVHQARLARPAAANVAVVE